MASTVLLGLVLGKVGLATLLDTLGRSNVYWLSLAILLSFAAWGINTVKWQVLLAGFDVRVGFLELLRLNFVGIFYNLVLPGQVAGEVIKSVKLANMGMRGRIAAYTVIADRVTGLQSVLVLGIVGFLSSPVLLQDQPQLVFWLLVLLVALTLASILLIAGRGSTKMLLLSRSLRSSNWSSLNKVGEFFSLFEIPTRSLFTLTPPLALALLFQVVVVLINFIVCLALGISIEFLQLFWIVAVVTTLQSLPISIAGIGVREGAYMYLLQLYAIPASSALALSVLIFSMQVLMAVVGGFWQLSDSQKNEAAITRH